MQAIVKEKQRELAELCRKYGVVRLALFGSALTDEFDSTRSDIDFAVEFRSMTPAEHYDAYYGLLGDLERIFQRKIDLVELGVVRNPYVRQDIEATQEVLYAP